MWDTACLWFGEPSVCCRRRGNKFCGGYLARHRQTAHRPMIENQLRGWSHTDVREESLPSAEYTSRIRVRLRSERKFVLKNSFTSRFYQLQQNQIFSVRKGFSHFWDPNLPCDTHTHRTRCISEENSSNAKHGVDMKPRWAGPDETEREKEETDSSAASGRISRFDPGFEAFVLFRTSVAQFGPLIVISERRLTRSSV